MPARKPAALRKRHDTKRERAARSAAESSTSPKTFLQKRPPAELQGHVHARAAWTRLVALYGETEGQLITAFDADILVKYADVAMYRAKDKGRDNFQRYTPS